MRWLSFLSSVLKPNEQLGGTGMEKSELLIKHLLEKNRIPGMAVMVTKEGKPIWEKGFGYADLEKKSPIIPRKTVFRVGSVSKPLAAAGLARMVAERVIDLDTSFYEYVTDYPKKKYDFTIRQLATHTAGIRSYKGKEYFSNEVFSIEEGTTLFKNDPLIYRPGRAYKYSSYDWVLISLAMQRAAGMPFETYMAEKVFKPLKMKRTMPDTGMLAYWLTTPYSRSGGKLRPSRPVHNFYKMAGGGFLSTAADISRFGNACLDAQLAPSAVMKEFLTAQKVKGKSVYYGLGWQVSYDSKNRPYYGHVGNGVGGYAIFYVYPASKIVFVILTHVTNPKIDKELNKIINYVFSDLH